MNLMIVPGMFVCSSFLISVCMFIVSKAAVNNIRCSWIQPEEAPDRTVCVAVDLSAAFDTVCHNNLLSKINRSQLPPATVRWLSC